LSEVIRRFLDRTEAATGARPAGVLEKFSIAKLRGSNPGVV